MKGIVKKLALLAAYVFYSHVGRDTSSLLVVTYHRLSERPDPTDPLKISVSTFENQIKFLKKKYSVISALDLSEAINGVHPLPKRPCLITFDDGWQDNYTLGMPVLRKYNVPALIFVSTNYIGTGKAFWHVRLRSIMLSKDISIAEILDSTDCTLQSELLERLRVVGQQKIETRGLLVNELIENLKKFPVDQIERYVLRLEDNLASRDVRSDGAMLSWEQISEMSNNGISFGSHTMSHAILTGLGEKEVRDELVASKRVLEHRLGQSILFFAYPNGDYNEETMCLTRGAGYEAGFTCKPGLNINMNRLFELKRINMREDSASGFSDAFSSLFYTIELSGSRFHMRNFVRRLLPARLRKVTA